jgi:hypothetical protein
MSKGQRIFLLLSIQSYTIALCLPAIALESDHSDRSFGFECLFIGMNITWTWAANPLLLIAWFLIWRSKSISVLPAIAALVCSATFAYLWLREPSFGHLLVGGYFWIASTVLASVASLQTLPRFQKRSEVHVSA